MSGLNPQTNEPETLPNLVDPFLDLATRTGFIDIRTAQQLQTAAYGQGVPTSRVAMNQGVLTHDQVDVLDSLLRPRELVAGYEIVSLLGQGGMGVVYRARQLSFDRDVALKMIRVGQAKPAMLARFEQEAKTIGRFAHPHIVTAFDFGRTEGRLYLAMEFLDGQDADQYVTRRGPLPEPIVWGLIRQAAVGLAYAAEQGVAHRDIKPANLILIDPPQGMPFPVGLPFVKIADFGLALLTEGVDERTRLTMENATVGSPPYMAPEQLSGSKIDHRADIYALGATAYHLLCGQPPFQGLPLAQLFTQKLHGSPTPLSQIRPELSEAGCHAVDSLMQRDPDQRTPDYAQVIALCDGLLGTAIPVATRSSLPPVSSSVTEHRERQPVPRRPRVLGMYGVVAGILLAIAVVLALVIPYSITRPPPAAPRNWEPTGWAVHCFDGRSLEGWHTVRGVWLPGQNDGEGGLVLAGRGTIAHPLTKPARQPLTGFRLLALGQLHQADVLEIQFVEGEGNVRKFTVCQLTPSHIRWGTRRTESGPLDDIIAEEPIATPSSTFHEFRFEWQAGEWLAYFDGQLLAQQLLPTAEPREFRLSAENTVLNADAVAWFSDVSLEELGPPRGKVSANP